MANQQELLTRSSVARSAMAGVILDLMKVDEDLARKEIAQLLLDVMDVTEQTEVEAGVIAAYYAFVPPTT